MKNSSRLTQKAKSNSRLHVRDMPIRKRLVKLITENTQTEKKQVLCSWYMTRQNSGKRQKSIKTGRTAYSAKRSNLE